MVGQRRRGAVLSRIKIIDVTGSTNSDLLEDINAVEGDWLIARRQDTGRGRQGRDWQSLDGNFFGSTLVTLKESDPSASNLSLIAGLALRDAIEIAAPQASTVLKWPNDVLLDGAKLAGILLERSGDKVVVGFGVNLAQAPEIEGRDTTCLAPYARMAPQAFAPLLAGAFARLLGAWRTAAPGATAMAWLQRSHPIGTMLKVHDGDRDIHEGYFAGIEDDGALRLKVGDTVEVLHAGDVTLVQNPS